MWNFRIRSFHSASCLERVASTGCRVKKGGKLQNSGGVKSKLAIYVQALCMEALPHCTALHWLNWYGTTTVEVGTERSH